MRRHKVRVLALSFSYGCVWRSPVALVEGTLWIRIRIIYMRSQVYTYMGLGYLQRHQNTFATVCLVYVMSIVQYREVRTDLQQACASSKSACMYLVCLMEGGVVWMAAQRGVYRRHRRGNIHLAGGLQLVRALESRWPTRHSPTIKSWCLRIRAMKTGFIFY